MSRETSSKSQTLAEGCKKKGAQDEILSLVKISLYSCGEKLVLVLSSSNVVQKQTCTQYKHTNNTYFYYYMAVQCPKIILGHLSNINSLFRFIMMFFDIKLQIYQLRSKIKDSWMQKLKR